MPFSFLLIATIALTVNAQRDRGHDHGGSRCSTNEAFLHDGFYYQFFDCPMPWNEAEAICKSNMVVRGRSILGGHLVSILSQEESDWLKFQLDMRYGRKVGVWIGMRRGRHHPNDCPEPTKWTDGNDLSYTNYLDGQPNCRWPGEDCFHIIDNEHWNDAECQVSMRFVCKIQSVRFSPEDQTTPSYETTQTQFEQTTATIEPSNFDQMSTEEPSTTRRRIVVEHVSRAHPTRPSQDDANANGGDDSGMPPPPPGRGK